MESHSASSELAPVALRDEHTPAATLIKLAGVEKVFRSGRLTYQALRGVDLSIDEGTINAIVGPSGSGKSTLLNMITGIDRPTEGTVSVAGQDLGSMSEEALAIWRGENVGIVFQFFQLIPTLTALENAILPMEFGPHLPRSERRAKAMNNLERVGLGDKATHFPAELSGGEQQRVAIARALARDPKILAADEPTGNLDSGASRGVLELLTELNRSGTTILLVTHDADLATLATRVVHLLDGEILLNE